MVVVIFNGCMEFLCGIETSQLSFYQTKSPRTSLCIIVLWFLKTSVKTMATCDAAFFRLFAHKLCIWIRSRYISVMSGTYGMFHSVTSKIFSVHDLQQWSYADIKFTISLRFLNGLFDTCGTLKFYGLGHQAGFKKRVCSAASPGGGNLAGCPTRWHQKCGGVSSISSRKYINTNKRLGLAWYRNISSTAQPASSPPCYNTVENVADVLEGSSSSPSSPTKRYSYSTVHSWVTFFIAI
jgi:hypothetical protein